MEMIMQESLKIVLGMVIAAVLYLIVQVISKCTKVLIQRLQQAQQDAEASGNRAKAAAFQFALTILNSVTYSVVSRIEAQKAYQLRKAVKAGEAQVTELELLSSEAYNQIVKLLGAGVKKCLDESVNDTEAFIREKIEELLPKVKADYLKTLPAEGDRLGGEEMVVG